jgi:hypothetical protein
MNPGTDFAALPADSAGRDSHLYLGCTGNWGVFDGGIEDIVVPGQAGVGSAAIRSAGFAITEAALGGDVVDVVADGRGHPYAIVSDAAYNTSLVSWDPGTGTPLATLYAPGRFSLSDAALDGQGELYVCNSSFAAGGLFVYEVGSDTCLAGPIATGLPPVQILFGQSGDCPPPVLPPVDAVTLAAPVPNPAHLSARLALGVPVPCVARVEIFDLGGRRVRTLADRPFPGGTTELVWDLLDRSGRRVPPGLYLACAVTTRATVARRFVVL